MMTLKPGAPFTHCTRTGKVHECRASGKRCECCAPMPAWGLYRLKHPQHEKVQYHATQRRWLKWEVEEEFWGNVRKEDDGCWTWTGAVDQDGHPTMSNGCNAMLRADRWAYRHFRTGAVKTHRLVRRCQTARCVNPAHFGISKKKLPKE